MRNTQIVKQPHHMAVALITMNASDLILTTALFTAVADSMAALAIVQRFRECRRTVGAKRSRLAGNVFLAVDRNQNECPFTNYGVVWDKIFGGNHIATFGLGFTSKCQYIVFFKKYCYVAI